MAPGGKIRQQEVASGMAHENPWFLITRSELAMIEEGLFSLDREIPEQSTRLTGKIAGIVSRVRERQP